MMRVDAHVHVWRVARGDYHWMPKDGPIARDFGLDDLRPLLGDVTAVVLVQAAATEAETHFMLEAARASGGLVRGVVGWTTLDRPGAVATMAAADPLLKGLRPMLHDLPERDWILRPEVTPGLEEMTELGLVLDALIRPPHLPATTEIARRHPRLSIVLDHGGKPEIAAGGFAGWAEAVAALARHPNVMCKLSGLPNEAAAGWSAEDLRPYVAHLLAAFGAERLLWGSDWPVVELAGGRARWRAATETLLRGLPASARDRILGGTAAAVYRLS
jgi:L-fuconolactonase